MPRRVAQYGTSCFVHFRTDEELASRLDEMVDRLKSEGVSATRSSVARTLLRRGLEADPTGGEVREVLSLVHRATQLALAKITVDVTRKLPTYLEQAHDELGEETSP